LDGFSQKEYISLYLYLGFFFEKAENSGLTPGQNDDPVAGDPDVKNDPNDPLTQFHV